MKKTLLLTIGIWLTMSVCCFAQDNAHLCKMTNDLVALRNAKSDNNTLNKVVLDWSAPGNPKITLMDDLGRDSNNEYVGKNSNKFKINQVVTQVYSRQNAGMKSKGDFFSSTEKGIFYSAIEKTIKKGCTVKYTLTGHVGTQEVVVAAYNPDAKLSVTVNSKTAKLIPGKPGMYSVKIPNVKKEDKMVFVITNSSDSNESIVVLIHNPQK